MNIETRVANLEKKHPPGQNIHITTWDMTLEEAIKKYEEEHGIIVDMNDPSNDFVEVVFIGGDFDENSNPIKNDAGATIS